MKDKLEYGKYVNLRDSYEKIVSRLANVRMIMFIVMILSFILKYYYYKLLFSIVFVISLVSFIIMVIVYDKYFKVYNYYFKYVEILDEYVKRENGDWKGFKDTGCDFLEGDGKYFFRDLDIVGDSSLFHYLSVCKTLGGREELLKRLSIFSCDILLFAETEIVPSGLILKLRFFTFFLFSS